MYILAIETTGKLSSVALMNEAAETVGYKVSSDFMSHLRNLVPMINELLTEAGAEKSQLTHVAASIGPGSFTGIRIGVSTARALCQSLELPAVAVPTLESFLYKKEAKEAVSKDASVAICAVINARRGQVYGMIGGRLKPQACMLADVLKVIKEEIFPSGRKVLFFGDGIDAYGDKITEELDGMGDYSFADEACRYQDAVSVGLLACEKVRRGEISDYSRLEPDYMRKAEAEQKLAAGELPICKGPEQE